MWACVLALFCACAVVAQRQQMDLQGRWAFSWMSAGREKPKALSRNLSRKK